MPQRILATMVTTTSYGTWLPGDLRGYVEAGNVLPGNPAVLNYSKHILDSSPVLFTAEQQHRLFESLLNAVKEFGYILGDCSIESWHLHWLIGHQYDPVSTVVGRLKNRMRQSLNVGRIWTEGYCGRCMTTDEEVLDARRYIAQHEGCRMIDGKIL